MPIFGHTFFGHYSDNLSRFRSDDYSLLKYRSVMKIEGMMLIFNFEFWVEFGEEMGVITTRAPQGLWLPNPTKKFTNLVE